MDSSIDEIALPTTSWIDIIERYPALAGKRLTLQCLGAGGSAYVVWGGENAPDGSSAGSQLANRERESGDAAHIWVRGVESASGTAPMLAIRQIDPIPVAIASTVLGPDRELVVSTYVAKANFVGAAAGDTITATQIIDVSTTPPATISTVWRNQSAAADLVGAPAGASLTLIGSSALTDAQMRAAPVPVSMAAVPLAADAATDAGLAAIHDALGEPLQQGGPVQIVDGALVTLGAKSDLAATSDTGSATLIALIKRLLGKFAIGQQAMASSLAVAIAADQSAIPVGRPSDLAATSIPLTGAVADTNAHILGPFTPQLGRSVIAAISAVEAASGTVQILRSFDGGTTKMALTAGGSAAVGGSDWASWSFSGLTGTIVDEEIDPCTVTGATYYLAVTLTAGSLTYRLAQ